MTCSNRPCGAELDPHTCPLVREQPIGRLIPLCRTCARLFVIAHPDRFDPVR